MNRTEILSEIHSLAKAYVPEWNPDSGDLGSAFALTFAEMQADTEHKLNMLPEKHHIEFLNAAGLPRSDKEAASSIVCFSLANNAEEGSYIDADTPVMTENNIVFTTLSPVYVTPSKLVSAYYCLDDAIYKQDELNFFSKENDVQHHALYICHDWAFHAGRGAELRLSFDGENCYLLGDACVIRWQYFTGQWDDFTNVHMDGQQLVMSIAKPPERRVTQDMGGYWLRALALSPSADEIRLESLHFGVSSASCECKLYHEGEELTGNGVYPFGKILNIYEDMHISCLEAFCKKGAMVEISFSLESRRQEIINPPPDIPVQWKRIMHKREFEPPPEYDVELSRTVLEYWNGLDFVLLPVVADQLMSTVEGKTRREISFRCPDDMALSVMHGRDSMWLRLRVMEITNQFKLNAHHIVPFVTDFEIRYSYPKPVLTGNLLACNNGCRNEVGKPFDFTHYRECAIYLGFDRPFGGSPTNFFWDVEPSAETHELRWQTFSQGKWQPFQVEGSFFQTGVTICYIETPMDPCDCFGEPCYWIKVSLGSKPKTVLRINSVSAGAVAVRQKIRDSSEGGGAEGNCAAGSVCKMNQTIGYISGVTNPLPMQGGRDIETPEHFLKHAVGKLKYRGRAMSAPGFEALTMEAASGLVTCKCIPAVNDLGEYTRGGVTIVYLPEERSDAYTQQRNDFIRAYLTERCPPQISVYVREVSYIELSIRAEISTKSNMIIKTQEQIELELAAFLHPVTGNFKKMGYQIGEIPDEQHLLSFLQSFEQVKRIDGFSVSAVEIDGLIRTEVDFKRLRAPAFAVPLNGQHSISVKGITK